MIFSEQQRIAPITASHFAAIADGFFEVRITRLGPQRWRISKRERLQTIRFDRAVFKTVDFTRSHGVVGQRHYQGSLYVALDEAVPEAVIALRPLRDSTREPSAARPYLIESRWQVSRLWWSKASFSFTAQGFGAGAMTWQVPAGRYHIEAERNGRREALPEMEVDESGRLSVRLALSALEPLTINVIRVKEMGS